MSADMRSTKITFSAEVEEELDRFEENIKALRAGQMDPNEFKKFRLNNGVYGIRGEKNIHMIRIKCKYGELNSDQLETLAELAEKFTRLKVGHVTTRQAVQVHHVHLDNVPTVLRMLND